MRDDERFEIVRAMDQLPHIAGASFATVWFRLGGNREPSKEEFRAKVVEHFQAACNALETFPDSDEFTPIKKYIRHRMKQEVEDITSGYNREIEKRYKRYLDYG
ncbi:MAG: hypothetical protein F4Y18_03690 [Cenarchaeum sp. SB0663_bin_5]|nr:hypothetical protein [Cenarchaeum sp. SB0663_bin_5]MYH03488.1 hypothetical protein [Cenarchaeum sp. SB0675_bin_21]MYL11998.1 hypothetical protein [Cenarchaeum sp. SB0669_bin_11]